MNQTVTTNLDLLYTVAPNGIRQILLCVLKPTVEGRRLLGEGQVQVLNLSVLVLQMQQLLFAVLGIGQKFLPAGHHCVVAGFDGRSLLVSAGHQLVFQVGYGLDAFLLKRSQASRECFLQLDTLTKVTILLHGSESWFMIMIMM